MSLVLILFFSFGQVFAEDHGDYNPSTDVKISADQCSGRITFTFLYLNTNTDDEKLKDFVLKIDDVPVLTGKDDSEDNVSETNCGGEWYSHGTSSDWCVEGTDDITFSENESSDEDFEIVVNYIVPSDKIGSEIKFELTGEWKEGSSVKSDFTGVNAIVKTKTIERPVAPNSFESTTDECNQVNLSWINPNISCDSIVIGIEPVIYGHCCYTIEFKKTRIEDDDTLMNWTDINQYQTYSDSIVEDGIEYKYEIRTKYTSAYGIESYSETISTTGNSVARLDPPYDFDGTGTCDNEVELSWQFDYTTSLAGFKIYRSLEEGGTYTVIDSVSNSARSFTDKMLPDSPTYYYKVSTKNNCGEYGELSDPIEVTVPASPTPPTNITATSLSNGILINWQDNSTNETGFIVLRTSATGFERSFDLDVNTTTFLDSTAANCEAYSYEVLVTNDCAPNGISGGAAEGKFVPNLDNLVSNTVLKASKGYYSNRIELSWENNGDPSHIIDSYNVYRKEMDSGTLMVLIASLDGGAGLFSDENANPGTIYEYMLVGVIDCSGDKFYTDTLSTYGFRTPTGDIYGRVTFESGQAEEDVEVRLETDEEISGKSLVFEAAQHACINDTSFLQNSIDSFTVQAWISPDDLSGSGKIFAKPGMYELGIDAGIIYFSVGEQTINSNSSLTNLSAGSAFVHLSGVYSGDSIFIYANGERIDSTLFSGSVSNSASLAVIGEDFVGVIDEMRVWNRALSKDEIARDYNRYVTGGENGLVAYYSFNFTTDYEFYDRSYKNNTYNEHHGELINGVIASESRIPTNEQLGYKGVTGEDGSYSIRAIPYAGNGTPYTIIPRKGIHQFEPQEAIRFIGEGSESFTVNFTDNSSFRVNGHVTYEGGTVPVEGVSFYIDGVVSMDGKGNVLMTDSEGKFEISVPVGSHEVIARKDNHLFAYDGRITDSYGVDLNYQDEVLGLELTDITKVRYIGRVAGGAEQESYILGHSLSTNNLGDSIKVKLSLVDEKYNIIENDTTLLVDHLIPSNVNDTVPKTNAVKYSQKTITIYPNIETGEFIADVIPELFRIEVVAPGHTDDPIPGSGENLDLSNYLNESSIIHDYTDSSLVDGAYVKVNYSDTVFYNYDQQFIKRYEPTIRITQLDEGNNELAYFGEESYSSTSLDGTETNLELYSNGSYALGYPVFLQNNFYNLKAEIFEEYVYYDGDENPKEGVENDEVPTQDATIEFTNNLAVTEAGEAEADNLGIAYYQFQVTEPELTSGLRKLSAKIYYGSEPQTSIDWENDFDGIIIGARKTGHDFVTGGPNRVLMVLRDPPGTNSYSYLEKGISISESSTYNWNVKNTGSETATHKIKTDVITFQGLGGGTITYVAGTESGFSIGVNHEETFNGSDSKSSVTTTTTRFETSSDPLYVGAEADVFVGYSTNIAYGATNNVSIISLGQYTTDPSKYGVFETITPLEDSEYLLVTQTGLGVGTTFGTLFAYTQKHIVNRLLPEMEALRNNFLMQLPAGMTIDELQQLATDQDTTFYVSYLDPSDPNYGKNNDDEAFDESDDPDPDDDLNGPSYRVINSQDSSYTVKDTISYLNQSIQRWYDQLEANEQAKLNAVLLENYSFQGGSPVSYSESYSTTESTTSGFDIVVGLNYNNDFGFKLASAGFKLTVDETVTTSHGKTDESSETQSHTKGFVLSETKNDYISVDVMHEDAETVTGVEYTLEFNDITQQVDTTWIYTEDDIFYSSFVFRTKAGATSCPYEGENVTQYYELGEHVLDEATMKIEVPEIAVEEDFMENVPTGEYAYFTLYLRNNSETEQSNWYFLKIVEESNPYGAEMIIDGAPIGNGREFVVGAGETLVKMLAVGKGSGLNYDNLKLVLESQCQYTITDTLTFSVHYVPSCSSVNLANPNNNWTYNTKLPTKTVNGVAEHYMNVQIDGFDVNYDSFNHIKLQYKSAAGSENDWTTLVNYFADSALIGSNSNVEMIDPLGGGKINYQLQMDDFPDQMYDLRAVTVCMINNEEIYNYSDVASGIKDMYEPRLFGSPQPADGILTIEDEIRLNFNEQIADGLLTKNNFQVTGIRNGTQTNHSVSISLDGINDYMYTEFDKNLADKDITFEMWVKSDEPQNATLIHHGNINSSIGVALTTNNHLQIIVGDDVITSSNTIPFEAGSWAHVAMVYSKDGYVSAYYNFSEVISGVSVGIYNGIGNFVLGKDIVNNANYFTGLMHGVRVWDKTLSSGELQVNSLAQLSGNEPDLYACYPMTRAKGDLAEDKARGANMLMEGCNWVVPDGRAVSFNGTDSYLKISTGSSAVIKSSMDYTIEFWFKAAPGQTNATLLSNGRGDGYDLGGSEDLFAIEIDENGKLRFKNNGYIATVDNELLDNNWHHFAINVGRTIGRSQIYIDGELVNFFDSNELGGIAATYMYIGARGWYEEGVADILNIDNFFDGSIDELRIWKLYKYESQIQESNNEKLDGTEMGLLAYYPFEYYREWQGVEELNFSLADIKVPSDPANAVPDAENVNGEQTSDIPPVKDKGPVSDLGFDFVVNNDALIITLNETLEKIEKSIVTFTVDGVQDINGNDNISPITWSAYIDRNQLKWSETKVVATKPLDESYEFTVQAVNQSGAIQNFVISNMPSWLSISPTSGTIDPSSSIDVTFKIDEGLNIGTYDECIYLTNSDNVSETLDLQVLAKGEKPDWSVNPADFDYSMSIYAKLRINNIFSSDTEDLIAAFVNGQCVGVADVEYEERNDMWYAFLTVYSNSILQDGIVYKIYDSSTGVVYLADAGEAINFENNKIVGTPADPKIFDAKEQVFQDIDLSPGWNWISFNVQSALLNSINDLLADMDWDADNFFKSEADNISASYSTTNGQWMGDENLDLGNLLMYKISTSVDQTISFSGARILPSSQVLEIKGNSWNYIGYLPPVRLKLDEALAGYEAVEEDIVKSQDGFAMYSGNIGWVGSLSFMEPGKGYMLFRTASGDETLIYPDSEGTSVSKNAFIEPTMEYVSKSYPNNMNIVAVTDVEPESNDRILAYVGNSLSSETTINDQLINGVYFITIPGTSNEPVSFVLERNGSNIGHTSEYLPFVANDVKGSIYEPYLLEFNIQEDEIIAYPNPARDEITISIFTEKTGDVEIRIKDITGRLFSTQVGSSIVNGTSRNLIDCRMLPAGLYFAHVILNGTDQVIKFEKQ